MKIAVIGAGAMGSLFGGRLAEVRNDVVLVDVDKAHVDAINEAGLRLEADDGDRHIRVAAGSADAFEGARDLLLVFTKGMHTEKAVASASHLIGPQTWALTVQSRTRQRGRDRAIRQAGERRVRNDKLPG